MKQFIKSALKKIPYAFTKNQKYDQWTSQIIAEKLTKESNCIDVGCFKGEVMDVMLKNCPMGTHIGFEPIPKQFEFLQKKYAETKNCRLFEVALAETAGLKTFYHVVSNPSYSGLQRRKYARKNEDVQEITVQTNALDLLIPKDYKIDFIKIDVEGGELGVLEGAEKLMRKNRPIVVFEHGLGGADKYGVKPEMVFDYFGFLHMKVYLLKAFLKNDPPLTKEEFCIQFNKGLNYYFVAAKSEGI